MLQTPVGLNYTLSGFTVWELHTDSLKFNSTNDGALLGPNAGPLPLYIVAAGISVSLLLQLFTINNLSPVNKFLLNKLPTFKSFQKRSKNVHVNND